MRLSCLLTLYCVAVSLCFAETAPSQIPLPASGSDNIHNPPSISDELDGYINQLLEGYNVPGLSLAIIDNGNIATKGYGYARLPSTPATPDTLWFTGSTTKAFTAAAAGILIADSKHYSGLKWTSRIHDHLPEFALQDEYVSNHITLEDALSHRSGLPSHDLAYGWGNGSLTDMIKRMRYLPRTETFRTTFQYCNAMFMVVSEMLERVSGQRLFDLIRNLIWQPLGMRSTFFFPAEFDRVRVEELKGRMARGYSWIDELHSGDGEGHFVPEPYMNLSLIAGAGAIVSSVNDYALWVKAFLQADGHTHPAGEYNYSSPITTELYNELVRQRIPVFGQGAIDFISNDFRNPQGYALGWLMASMEGYPVIFHNGGLNGFGTNIWIIPDLQIGVVTMANTGDSHSMQSLIGSMILKTKLQSSELRHVQNRESVRREKSPEQVVRSPSCCCASRSAATQKNSHGDKTQKGSASQYTGVYHHPAYGAFEITVAQGTRSERCCQNLDTHDKSKQKKVPNLHVRPSNRTWLSEFSLEHDTGTWFQATEWEASGMYKGDAVPGLELGCSGSKCKDIVVWEYDDDTTFVNFEYDPSPIGEGPRFQKAAMFGIHLSGATNDAAMGYGEPGTWRDGAIWFERRESV